MYLTLRKMLLSTHFQSTWNSIDDILPPDSAVHEYATIFAFKRLPMNKKNLIIFNYIGDITIEFGAGNVELFNDFQHR